MSRSRLAAAAVSMLLAQTALAGTALAQTATAPAQAHAAPAAAQASASHTQAVKVHSGRATPSLAAPGANTTGHSAAAIDCSKQADAKALHGKARASFRASCKASAKKS